MSKVYAEGYREISLVYLEDTAAGPVLTRAHVSGSLPWAVANSKTLRICGRQWGPRHFPSRQKIDLFEWLDTCDPSDPVSIPRILFAAVPITYPQTLFEFESYTPETAGDIYKKYTEIIPHNVSIHQLTEGFRRQPLLAPSRTNSWYEPWIPKKEKNGNII